MKRDTEHSSQHPDVGRVLGSFRLVALLGQGGMGEVFLAEHIRVRREVALKRLRGVVAKRPDAAQQLFSEARAVNRIRHPHIVEITDYVDGADGVYYIMEYLKGQTLATLLASTDAAGRDGDGGQRAELLSIFGQMDKVCYEEVRKLPSEANDHVVVNLSGRGDKDLEHVASLLGGDS